METNFAKLVSEILTAYGYTEAALAEKIGVSQPTVHRIKTGESENPGYATGFLLSKLHADRPRGKR